MHNHQTLHQYQSDRTEQPTVTLGNQYERQTSPLDPSSFRKEHPYHPIIAEQHSQNIKMQYERELQICHSEIETLKEQIELQQKQKDVLQQTIINLKKDRAALHSENQKLFQQNQKNRQLVQKLKIDNRSMEMEIDRFRGQRKVYYNNINNIETLKRDLSTEIALKNNMIDQLNSKLRKNQRNNSQFRIKIEEYDKTFSEMDEDRQLLREELKSTLQKYISHGNLLNKLEYQLKEANQLNRNMKDRIYDLQKERQEFLLKLGYDLSSSKENNLSESNRSTYPTSQKSMLEIQSYMKQIGNLLDLKKEDFQKRRKNYDKLKHSIQSLQHYL